MPQLFLDSLDIEAQVIPVGVGLAATPAKYGTTYELVFDHIMGIIGAVNYPVVRLVQGANNLKYTKVGPETAHPQACVLIQRDVRYGEPQRQVLRGCASQWEYLESLWTLELHFDQWVVFDPLAAALNSESSRYTAAAPASGIEAQTVLVQGLQPRHPKPGQPEQGSAVTVTLLSRPASQIV